MLEFGPFQIDVDARLLTRMGEPVALTPKAFDTLLALVESDGEIVDKETLIRRIWPDTAVEENNLTQNISKLRKALDDDRLAHRYIVTIPRRGYKFVARVRHLRAGGRNGWQRGQSYAAGDGRQTQSAAYVEHLRGRYLLGKRSPAEIEKSIACFERAIFDEPGLAPAHAGLASAYAFLGLYQYNGADPRVYIEKARHAVDVALGIEPRLAEAVAVRGLIRHGYDFDWAGAEADFRLAYELDPSYQPLDFWFAVHALVFARFDDAERAMRHAYELDPASPMATLGLGSVLFYRRSYMRAIDAVHRTLDLEPSYYRGNICAAHCYEQIGFYDQAIEYFERAQESAGVDCETVAAIGHVRAKRGETEAAGAALAELAALAASSFVSPFYSAVVHAGLGDCGAALDRIEEALETRALWPLEIARDPRLDPLRESPRFRAVLGALRLN
jgi:DNA-binding winged helix-turn-helix (wHTH) protein